MIAARLGAAGIVTQLRGGGIEGPYPMGPIEVLVSEDDFDDARELLLADDVESAFDDDERRGPTRAPLLRPRLIAALVLVCLLATTLCGSSARAMPTADVSLSGRWRTYRSAVVPPPSALQRRATRSDASFSGSTRTCTSRAPVCSVTNRITSRAAVDA